MSRQLRRVPLDFTWPKNKVWSGFVMSENIRPAKCDECDGTGSSPEGRQLHALWYGYVPFRPEDNGCTPLTPDHPGVRSFAERNVGRSPAYYGTNAAAIEREANRLCALWNGQWSHHLNQREVDALVDGGRLFDFTHRWDAETRKSVPTGYRPTAQEVNDWSLQGFGHDSINQWVVCKAVLKSRGQPSRCAICDGEGHCFADAEHKAAYDAWESTDPPEGPGYQMWETVSEGSPISPVFDTSDKLALWLSLARPDDGNYDDWMKMIEGDGWAPSMVISNGSLMSGVQFVGNVADA